MKRLVVILVIIVCLFLLAVALLKPAIVILTKKQLQGVFKQAQVSIGRCEINFARQLSFFDLQIKQGEIYNIKIGEAAVRYNLFSILTPSFRSLLLKTAKIYVNTPKREITQLLDSFGVKPTKPGAPVLGKIGISEIILDLNTKDAQAKVSLSCELDLMRQAPNYLDVKISAFEMFGLKLEDAILKLGPQSPEGNFSIARLKYNRLGITDIKGVARLQNAAVILSGITAQALNGNIEGTIELKVEKEAQYVAHLKCFSLDMEKLVRDFNWHEKFEMSGKLSGEFRIKGKGAQFELLDGDFSALAPGGVLTIKDAKFLDDMARNAKLLEKPMDLIVESFKNYSYNTAIANAGLKDGNVILTVELEGEAGKRNLDVILHDFKLGN